MPSVIREFCNRLPPLRLLRFIPDATGADRRSLWSADFHAVRLAFGVTDIQPQSGGPLASEACLHPQTLWSLGAQKGSPYP